MLLQFVVIHYDEDETYIKSLLNVLKMQQNIDFNEIEVLIENDGDKLVYNEKLFEGYPFKIQYHVNPWTGRSGVRQFGLDRATADYVMFCDCDDTFLRFDALYDVFKALKSKQPDVLFSKFVADHVDENEKMVGFSQYYAENVWIHGKVFKVDFLRKHNIKWNQKLNNYEDSYFVRLIDAYNPQKIGIETPTYLWKHRASSCTRNGESRVMLDYNNKVNSEMELISEFKRRQLDLAAGSFMYSLQYECYYTSMAIRSGEELSRDFTTDIDAAEKRFIEFYLENHELADKIPAALKSNLYAGMVDRFFKSYKRATNPVLTFEEWITELTNKYGGQQ